MKKYLLLLLAVTGFAQTNPTAFNRIRITQNIKDNLANRIVVQDSTTGELKWVLKSSLTANVPQANASTSGTVRTTTAEVNPQVYTIGIVDNKLDAKLNANQKGAINGVATLNSIGKIPNEQIPAVAISETFPISSEAQMIGLSQAEQGDIAIRSDVSKAFILRQSPSSVLGNWSELLTPASTVTSVSGKVGAVILNNNDVGLGNVDNTSDANKPISSATQTALDIKNPLISHLEFSNADLTVWNNGKGNLPSNTSFGDGALRSNTTGNNNNGFGANALFFNTTGGSNNGFGANALFFNTTGTANTVSGTNALRNNTTGSFNVAIGDNSGRLISDGVTANIIVNNSVFFGNDTRPLANNQTNQIVIGNTAIGAGSNSVTLGNTSITNTVLRGLVTAPTFSGETGLFSGNITALPATLSTQVPTLGQVETALNLKENTITAGTTAQYFRGDKTFQTLNSEVIGLGNVPNTNFSSAVNSNTTNIANLQTSLNAKANDNEVVKLTGNQSIFGTKQFRSELFISNGTTDTFQFSIDGGSLQASFNQALGFKTATGTASQFLKANGSVDSNVYATEAALNGKISGSGTTNQLAKFTASSAVGPSSIFDNGNVGIGTTLPNFTATNRTTVDINGVSQSLLALSVGGTGRGFLFHTGTDLLLSNEVLGALKFNVNGSERVTILNNGNVGIGTINPTEKLEVVGNGKFSGTITASPATASNQLVTKAQLDANIRPYKVYTALLVQSGTTAPVATVLENNLGGTVIWTRNSVGSYFGTLSNAFTTNKTFPIATLSMPSNTVYTGNTTFQVNNQSTSVIELIRIRNDVMSDGFGVSLEIRVYN